MNEGTNTKALVSVSATFGAAAEVEKTFTIVKKGTEFKRTFLLDVPIARVARGYVDNLIIRTVQDATRIGKEDKESLRTVKRANRAKLEKFLDEHQKMISVSALLREMGKDPNALPGSRSRKSFDEVSTKMVNKMTKEERAIMLAKLLAEADADAEEQLENDGEVDEDDELEEVSE